LYSGLNISNNKQWAYFLEDYFYMLGYGYSICGVKYWHDILDFYQPVGNLDCETYTQNRTIQINLSSLVIPQTGAAAATVDMTASSSASYYVYNIGLPLSVQSMPVRRIAINDVPDSGFEMQTTINGRNGPKIFRIRGNKVDMTANNGVGITVYYGDPGNMIAIGSATLYSY
ncbi:MAG: hypothetical protein KDD34_07870, partial [Bdellovibrionales bacterium]|nr:hypothetical protein [Bdellovibrionales bacterium]